MRIGFLGRNALGLTLLGLVVLVGGGLGVGWLFMESAGRPDEPPVADPADTASVEEAKDGGDGRSVAAPRAVPPPTASRATATASGAAETTETQAATTETKPGTGTTEKATSEHEPGTGTTEKATSETEPGTTITERATSETEAPAPSLMVPGPQPPADGSEPHARVLARATRGATGAAVTAGTGKDAPQDREAAANPPQAVPEMRRRADGKARAGIGNLAVPPRVPKAEAEVEAEAEAEAAGEAEAGAAQAEAEADVEDEAVADAKPDLERPRRPAFDVVRVDPSGQTVVAGRAPAGAKVTLEDESGKVLGATRANENKEFVLVPRRPLEPGAHEFSLRAETPDTALRSKKGVVAVVPEPGSGLGGTRLARPLRVPARESSKTSDTPAPASVDNGDTRDGEAGRERPLVMLVPREESAETASQIVQRPDLPSLEADGKKAAGGDKAPVPVAPAPGKGEVPPPAAVPEGASSADESVRVDVIEYGAETPLDVRGEATPGAEIEAYLEDEKIGEAQADRRGEWQVTADRPVPPGNYRLRVDRLGPGGDVAARLVMPFERAEPPSPDTRNDFVIVQPGHNLWQIARRVYGQGVRYTQIYEANNTRIDDPDLIYPGQVFQLPRDGEAAPSAPPEQP